MNQLGGVSRVEGTDDGKLEDQQDDEADRCQQQGDNHPRLKGRPDAGKVFLSVFPAGNRLNSQGDPIGDCQHHNGDIRDHSVGRHRVVIGELQEDVVEEVNADPGTELVEGRSNPQLSWTLEIN